MEMDHMSVRRGVSWSPGGGRKPLQGVHGGNTDTGNRESGASWERRDYRGIKGQVTSTSTNQLAWKTNLTRSASLSEKELKEARVRSQIIAAQLTVPSGCSNSRGVQLFNRRKQRVNAFTLESGGERTREVEREERDRDTRNNNLAWEEERGGPSEGTETDKKLKWKNSCGTKTPLRSPPSGSEVTGSYIMEDPGDEHIYEEVDVIQERHFQPVNEREEEEEERSGEREREEIYEDIEGEVKNDIIPVNDNNTGLAKEEVGMNGGSYTDPIAPPETRNGFQSTQDSAGEIQNGVRVSMSLSRQTPTIVNRTARPFFSPPTVQLKSPEAKCPVMDNNLLPAPSYPTPILPPAPSYPTPTLPPAPSYPTPTLPPAFSYPTPTLPSAPSYPTRTLPSAHSYPTPTLPPAPSYPTLPPAPSYPTPTLPPAPSYPTPTLPSAHSYPTPTLPPAPSYPTPTLPSAHSYPTPTLPPAPSYPTPTIPRAPSFSTPPLPAFTATCPVAFSPPPPTPSYPMPLPAFPIHPPPPVMFPRSTPVPQYNPPPTAAPVSQYLPHNPPVTQYIPPPSSPRPNTFVPFTPLTIGQPNQQQPIKTGILEEGTAAIRRSLTARKSMFTFKEKPVMAPNPELLSLVQGNDDMKKHGLRSVPEPAPEEELLALGAEASNFLAREELKAEAAKVPEWSSCLKSSRTREPRGQHQPEQTLTNASGKGAELFAKRQSRMEKYVVENQNGGGQMRPSSPTASLPPSWVYPSNMPGRVKAIANNTDISARLTRTLQTPQPGNRRPSQQAPSPAPVPEEPHPENGCTKIEMDLSRHQPYQLHSSLYIFNPVQAPPPPKPLVPRQASLPSSNLQSHNYHSLPRFRPTLSPSLQPPSGGIVGGDYYPPQHGGTPQLRDHRITCPVSAFSPERVASPRSGIQAPRPTFSAKRAGIEPQTRKESPPTSTPTSTRTPQFTRQFSSPEGPPSHSGVWSPTPQNTITPSSSSRPLFQATATSPVSPPWKTRCQSPAVVNQTTKPFSTASLSRPKPSTTTSPISSVSPWGSRCQSPNINQTTKPFTTTISNTSSSRPSHPGTITSALSPSPLSPPWSSRCQSPIVSPSHNNSKANHRLLAKNIINAAKRKNSPSPGALSGHNLPISPLGGNTTHQHHQGYDSQHHHSSSSSKPPFSPYQSRAIGCQSPPFASPPPTSTRGIRSPVKLYNTRSLTDSDASVESEDSGLRSPGLQRTHNTCPRGWGGSLRVKRGSVGTDL